MDDCGGFWRVQRRLQEEARVALALARPMARMQVEVERQIQMHRRSPVADLVSLRVKAMKIKTSEAGRAGPAGSSLVSVHTRSSPTCPTSARAS